MDTKIELVNSIGKRQKFTVECAENLFRIFGTKSGWSLPENSKWEYKDGTFRKRNSRKVREEAEQ